MYKSNPVCRFLLILTMLLPAVFYSSCSNTEKETDKSDMENTTRIDSPDRNDSTNEREIPEIFISMLTHEQYNNDILRLSPKDSLKTIQEIYLTDLERGYKKISGETQGTTYNITYQDSRDLRFLINRVLFTFDLSLSAYEPRSIISRINRNEPDVYLDGLFLKVFQEARKVFEETSGAFDITVGPVVNAWGFGPGEKQEADSALINSLLQLVGMDKIAVKDGLIVKEDPGIILNVNAIAQGYSVDVVAEYLDYLGIRNYLVEIGGELKCTGRNPKGEDWKIGVDRPVDGNQIAGADLQVVLAVKTKSLATSGNYRKYFEMDGVKYAHSIDPKTGYPVLGRLLSATILADECIAADAYATACMVMGLERSIEFLDQHPELEAYLIYSDEQGNFKVFTTPGMKEHVIH